jgi:PadR family transcriptional regulator AphA
MDERASTVESLLGMLSLTPMSGYEIRRLMEYSTANFWSESYGQIYPALKRMLAEGLIETVPAEKALVKDDAKEVYRITAAGTERLRSWLSVPARPGRPRNELLLKVFFGSRAESGAMAMQVEIWKERYEADLKRYQELEIEIGRDHPDPFFLMTIRYGIMEATAVLVWCDDVLAELYKH